MRRAVRKTTSSSDAGVASRLGARLTSLALVIAASVVIARATMTEEIRQPFETHVGSIAFPSGASAASGLVFNMIGAVPAILILARRAFDPTYSIRLTWTHLLAGLLSLWVVCSISWADDRFLAVISASHWIAAMLLLWTASQLVRTWLSVRFVAALCFGLLLVNLVQATYYQLVDLPDLQRQFFEPKYHDAFLKSQGWAPDSYAATQYDAKIRHGEMMGFTASSNSFASVLVLLSGVSAGLILQRLRDREKDAVPWSAGMGVVFPITIWLLYHTQSKAAAVMPVLLAMILLMTWNCRKSLARRPGTYYVAGVALVLMVIAATIACGVHSGRLPTDSLKFRWRYWIAAWHMFLERPMVGFGWANFGPHYLRFRVAAAAEEIQDPHNFLIRFFVETGMIGGLLVSATTLRAWWEWTRPIVPPDPPREKPGVVGRIAIIAAAAMALNSAASIDWSQAFDYVAMQLMTRFLYALALIVGAAVASLRSMSDSTADDRPAPWILYAILASLGVFLIHNLIEFSLFETGPMMIFALLAGSALGARQPERQPRPQWTLLVRIELTGALVAFFAITVALIAPTIQAESAAAEADELLRQNRAEAAAADYLQAATLIPFNADYRFRHATALIDSGRADARTILQQINQAIAENPSSVDYYLSRAQIEQHLGDVPSAKKDYEKAIELNPIEVDLRLQYCDALVRMGDMSAARDQYRQALKYNDLLPPDEPKRRTGEQLRLHQPP